MNEEEQSYMSYLLRLWKVKEKEKPVWRASLESPHTGELTGFGNLAELWHFLQQQTRSSSGEKGVSVNRKK